jgi:hypothetical protein
MARSDRFQFFFQKETSPGTAVSAATLFTAANGKLIPSSPPTFESAPEIFERTAVRPSLSPLTPLIGAVNVTVGVQFEMVASAVGAGTAPVWAGLMESCGFRGVVADSYTMGEVTVAQAFQHGENLTDGGSGQATQIFDLHDGDTTLWVEPGTGDLAAETTGGTTGAVGTPSGKSASAGYAFVPTSSAKSSVTAGTLTGGGDTPAIGDLWQGDTSLSYVVATNVWASGGTSEFRYVNPEDDLGATESLTRVQPDINQADDGISAEAQVETPTLSIGIVQDGVRRMAVGCRGTVSGAVNIGESVILTMEFTGKLMDPVADGRATGVEVTSIVRDQLVPPAFLGVGFLVGDDTTDYDAMYEPAITSFSFDVGNGVGVQRDATEAAGLVGAAEIRTRSTSCSFDPALRPEEKFGFIAALEDGSLYRIDTQIGSTAGNTFRIQAPAFQPTSMPTGDRDGEATHQVSGQCSAQLVGGSEGEDRELIFLIS